MCEKIQGADNYWTIQDAGNYLINNEKLVFNFGYYITLGIMPLSVMELVIMVLDIMS